MQPVQNGVAHDMDVPDKPHRKAIIGNINSSFWLYDSAKGFDLTHPTHPLSPTTPNAVRIETTGLPITVDPSKSALVIIDMQNFFLSTALGRSPDSRGLDAQRKLLEYAIPAARQAGMRILWVNWGLTEDEIKNMPPSVIKCFGFETVEASQFESHLDDLVKPQASAEKACSASVEIEKFGKNPKVYQGLGNQMGPVTLNDGSQIQAGRVLMRDQWNTALTPELSGAYQQGLKCSPPDVWIHKNRMSGFWGASTACTEFLDVEGISTLFFAGVNTDQCVGGSLTDAFSRGYDCILLGDGAATSSPQSCQETYEFNAAGTYGFCTSCKDLWDGVKNSTRGQQGGQPTNS